jgi:23S rRNA (uracil1939-C5)-methyltransferase
MQHMIYDSQIAAKQRIIADAMYRIGKREVPVPTAYTSNEQWRYRAKLTLALRRKGTNWIAGLHAFDDPGHVFALSDCLITDRRVVSAWRAVMNASQFFPDERQLRGSVRWTDAGPVFVLIGGRRWTGAQQFFDSVPLLAAVYWEPDEQPRSLIGDRRAISTPAASFVQVNPAVAEQLRAYVLERILSYTPRTVVDAYAGNGELSMALAKRGVSVTAIELDAEAAAWSESQLPEHAKSVRARVEDVLSKYLPTDVLVLNPPRAGIHENVSHVLQRSERPPAILYVSCDPATLARDVARLSNYHIASMIAFDMFPQTAHVETVCELVARHA